MHSLPARVSLLAVELSPKVLDVLALSVYDLGQLAVLHTELGNLAVPLVLGLCWLQLSIACFVPRGGPLVLPRGLHLLLAADDVVEAKLLVNLVDVDVLKVLN